MTVAAVAHRGHPYVHRENTLPSVRAALLAGADAVEIDVRITRDRVPVLLHDPTLRRMWGLDRAVADITAAELRRVGDAAAGLLVPTLHQALAAMAAFPGSRAMIDLVDREAAAAALAHVADGNAAGRVYFCGTAAPMLAVRRLDRDAEIALTWKSAAAPPSSLLAELRPRWLNLPFGLAGPARVAEAHASGLRVAAWTVDVRRNMTRLIRAGVDSITTNRVDALRGLLRQPHGRRRRATEAGRHGPFAPGARVGPERRGDAA